jgi:hypothetical protein
VQAWKGEVTKAQSVDQVECRGLNARISVRSSRIIVSHILPPKKMEISLSDILAIELVVNSIFPPIMLSIVSVAFLVSVWWFAGGWSWPIVLPTSYLSISSWAALSCAIGLVATAYAWLFGKINIATVDNHTRVTVQMIPKRSGEAFVYSIRHTMQETEQ